MPTQRQHGGAPISYRPLNTPGFMGLNTQAAGTLLGPEWATRLENTVIDQNNRLASRAGWTSATNTPVTGADFQQLHEEQSSGNLFASGDDGKLYKSTDSGGTWSDVSGTTTIPSGVGQFADFNGTVIYGESGQKSGIYSGTNFVVIADASAPTGDAHLSSFGRYWRTTASGKAFQYSALLDATDFSSADSGTVDMTSVWQGDDTIVALANFNNSLIVLGRRNIVMYDDDSGSVLGLDPTAMTVRDITGGVGCLARDSVADVEGDIWFLSYSGIMSYGRLTEHRDNPLKNISQHVQDYLFSYVPSAGFTRIRAVYSPTDRFYLLSLPSAIVGGTEACFCFDTRKPMQDGAYRCAGTWSLVPTAMVVTLGRTLYMADASVEGEIGRYSLSSDDGTGYTMEYEGGWSDFDSPYLKILKRLSFQMYVGGTTKATAKWALDWDDTFKAQTLTIPVTGAAAEYGIAEWNIGEYFGGVVLRDKNAAGSGAAEHIKVGFTATVNGTSVALQQIGAYAKEGRLK